MCSTFHAFTFTYFICCQTATTEMTRSTVCARETVQLLWQETPDFISPDLCPPNSPVDYIICGLMQERVYVVQTPVRDTSRCDQKLEAAPH